MKTFAIVSLGCSRNTVDSEVIAGSMKSLGLRMTDPGRGADLYIINTCSFIESARAESIEAILEASRLKAEGKVSRIAVCGCLPQMYKGKLFRSLPEADIILGSSDFPKLERIIRSSGNRGRVSDVSARPDHLYDGSEARTRFPPRHLSYIKISEGCSNLCSYCVISNLRGRARSRPIGSVVSELARLSSDGKLKEAVLVGQDTTVFGLDLYGKPMLPELLRRLSRLKGAPRWIRLMYTHPAHYTDELIDTIRDERRICRYLDLPIQHASDRILKAMKRGVTKRSIDGLIDRLRDSIPGLALRTSVIVGFPGESDKDFKELLAFLRDKRFERLGAFAYSRESGTGASRMPGQIPDRVKAERYDEVMRLQQKISLERNRSLIGRRIEALIDEEEAGGRGVFSGRTEHDAPDVDGVVYVSGKSVKAGEFRDVRITDAMEYDLVGESIKSTVHSR
jgi:ribosomal protein S12 methylthiotransferase